MIDERTKVLIATVNKLYKRGARKNIQKILKRSHTADVAALLQSLSPEARYEIFLMEPELETKADILSYLEEDEQKELLSLLSREEVLKLVSLMEKDDAADLLGNLPEEESKTILSSMIREDSEEVADLMGYPDDSAGGLMSSDYLAVHQDLTVGQAIESIQSQGEDGRITFYLYVIDDSGQLVGVVSLKQLLLAKRSDALKSFMYTDVISVNVNTHQEEVAQVVERYDFLSLPVVDGNNQLVGIITVDDVIDVIREEAEEDLLAMGRAGWGVNVSTYEHFKARFPWLALAFLGGTACFAIVYAFGSLFQGEQGRLDAWWLVAAFIPLIISVGATTGSQAATVAVGAIRSGKFDVRKVNSQLRKEFRLSLLFAAIFGAVVLLVGQWLFASYGLTHYVALAMALQIVLSVWMGATLPIAMHKFGMDPTVASVPVFTALSDLTAVLVLFSFVYWMSGAA